MITVQKKLIACTHGIARIRLPEKYRILSVGPSVSTRAIPVFVEIDDTHELHGFVDLEVCLTNKRRPEAIGAFIGTCEIDSSVAAHIYMSYTA